MIVIVYCYEPFLSVHLLLCEMDTYNPSILGIGQKNGTRNRY